jgi:hypothetical protein
MTGRAIAPGLILAIAIVYAQAIGFVFIDVDDDLYVVNNPHVLKGLTPENIKWSLTAEVASNWMPVTLVCICWMSSFSGCGAAGTMR